jgi:hypothetical protein
MPRRAMCGVISNLRTWSWLSALAADRRDRLDQRDELGYVVAVATGGDRGQRDAVRVDDDMVLAAGLAPIYGGRAGGRPPFIARM